MEVRLDIVLQNQAAERSGRLICKYKNRFMQTQLDCDISNDISNSTQEYLSFNIVQLSGVRPVCTSSDNVTYMYPT